MCAQNPEACFLLAAYAAVFFFSTPGQWYDIYLKIVVSVFFPFLKQTDRCIPFPSAYTFQLDFVKILQTF
jgi:hypothetical protein